MWEAVRSTATLCLSDPLQTHFAGFFLMGMVWRFSPFLAAQGWGKGRSPFLILRGHLHIKLLWSTGQGRPGGWGIGLSSASCSAWA
jgi:hypothetical protein